MTHRPSPRSSQAGTSSCAAVMCASMFTRIVGAQSSWPPRPLPVPMPALAKKASTRPEASNARLSSAASATSPATALACSPIASAACETRSASRSTSTACSAPRSSAAFAIARPIPPAAPVTTIRLPVRSMAGTYSPSSGCASAFWTSHRSQKGRPPPTRWRTRSTWRGSPTSSATTATGWPSTTAARCSAGHAPEALIPSVAAATSRIRVGSGGVMLPHYSPFKVAEVFTLLAAMYPGRIDLGLGRASGTDPRTTYALQRDRSKAMRGRLPPAARRAAGLPRRHAAGRPSVRVADELAARAAPGGLAARLLAAVARSGPTRAACATRSRTSSTPTARSSPSRADAVGGLGRSARRPRRRRSGWRRRAG